MSMTGTKTLDDLAGEDILDSRDLIERLAELEGMADDDESEMDDDEREELAELREICEEGNGYAPDWQYGETLIRDSYFKDYAMDFADSIGAINSESTWPIDCIDWDQAARELQMDYTVLTIRGIDYWVR